MHHIQTSIVIKSQMEKVFQTLIDIGNYPNFMRYVKDVKVQRISDNEIISNWQIDIEGADINWSERDIFDHHNRKMVFSMLQGDYGTYYGTWHIDPHQGRTRLSLDVYVDWDVPSFEKIIGPILEQKTKKVLRGMLAAIKIKIQKPAVILK